MPAADPRQLRAAAPRENAPAAERLALQEEREGQRRGRGEKGFVGGAVGEGQATCEDKGMEGKGRGRSRKAREGRGGGGGEAVRGWRGKAVEEGQSPCAGKLPSGAAARSAAQR